MTTEMVMIGISVLIVIGILLHHPSRTLGIPSLLIFMGVGLSLGNGEFNFVYDNLDQTAWIGGLALNVIVFVGGLNTSTDKIKVAYKEGGVLASFGVIFTTLIFAAILYGLLDFNLITCLLFAAIVSSTDAAAVFSILESKKLKLKEQTDTVLEFESATNDPVAMLMVIVLTDMTLASHQAVAISALSLHLASQILVAIVVGFLIGKLAVLLLNRISLAEFGLIPVFVLASFIIATYSAEMLGGNILLASYIAGVVIGNGIKRGQLVNLHFFNSLSWLAQALMFIVLGLQIFPQTLMNVFWISIIPGLLLILVARPLAVQLCYLPFVKASWKKRLFISMIGLKGATPIVFALIPAAAGVPGAIEIVHMVFFFVLMSVFIQGGAIAPLANKLGLEQKEQHKAE
ncbi:potassium/proton antiporter [Shewanella sp. 10N.286.48.B5]|uniref:potassium/proton antiporter n=1 Tax=Shewanella sp. 10N.286.48.B5 TaxID=1880834 RepID=UPI000C848537|nr:potassium/proton antiporter [Shewanella sp. 10N.286.48.B5]PMH85428.1 sodium:proton exchanger [Shewanella sp. 10N.286.48.B5]